MCTLFPKPLFLSRRTLKHIVVWEDVSVKRNREYYKCFVLGVNPCNSVRCSHGEECVITKFGIARCECPGECQSVVRPVCGSNGETYDSVCHLDRAVCLKKTDIKVAYTGECGKLICVVLLVCCAMFCLSLLHIYTSHSTEKVFVTWQIIDVALFTEISIFSPP